MNINQGGVTFRQEGALKRLEAQLLSGTKPIHEGKKREYIPLTDSDRKRIEKEINVLRSKLKLQIAA